MVSQNRLLASSATSIPETKNVNVDVGGILRRLLLFDTYILNSIRLKEFPEIVKRLGFDVTLQLLSSEAFKIHCSAQSTAQTGQATVLKSRERKGALPKGSFCFQSVIVPDRRDYISGCFRESIDPISISTKQQIKLKRAILGALEEPPDGIGSVTIEQLRADFHQNNVALKTAVLKELKKQFKIEVPASEVKVQLHPIDNEDFYSESNLMEICDLDVDQHHKLVERAALDLAGVNQRIAEMNVFNAISGFRLNDLPIFEKKVEFIVNQLDPEKQEKRSQRVYNIAEVPDFRDVGISYDIDIDRFFKIRESSECAEFRNWLLSIDCVSDRDIKDQLSNLRDRVATIANTKTARSLRFLASSALGLIPGAGLVLGPAASALDSFLIDKVLKKSGIVTFIGHMYPSLFEDKN